VADIQPPSPIEAAVKANGSMFQRFRDWTQLITQAVNFNTVVDGTGNPEGVLSSQKNKFYNDAAAGDLYWKSVDDIAGDSTQGWKLIS